MRVSISFICLLLVARENPELGIDKISFPLDKEKINNIPGFIKSFDEHIRKLFESINAQLEIYTSEITETNLKLENKFQEKIENKENIPSEESIQVLKLFLEYEKGNRELFTLIQEKVKLAEELKFKKIRNNEVNQEIKLLLSNMINNLDKSIETNNTIKNKNIVDDKILTQREENFNLIKKEMTSILNSQIEEKGIDLKQIEEIKLQQGERDLERIINNKIVDCQNKIDMVKSGVIKNTLIPSGSIKIVQQDENEEKIKQSYPIGDSRNNIYKDLDTGIQNKLKDLKTLNDKKYKLEQECSAEKEKLMKLNRKIIATEEDLRKQEQFLIKNETFYVLLAILIFLTFSGIYLWLP
jgi:hypothetical protein